MLIVRTAGEEVLLCLHFSMSTVWTDAALSGQPVLSISDRLYSQSMTAQSVSLSLSLSYIDGYDPIYDWICVSISLWTRTTENNTTHIRFTGDIII